MNEITSEAELENVLAQSNGEAFFLFKHSTRCPISARAHARLDDYLARESNGRPPLYLIKVVESRNLSNAVTEMLGVNHQSPQLLLVKDGKSLWDASHGEIRAENIDAALDALRE